MDAAANTREVISFLVWAHEKIQKNRKRKNPKKIEKEKSKKKIEKGNSKKKKLLSVVLDKMCIFCFYPISDSQQRVKRGNCRCPVLSGLFCFNF